MKAVEYKINLSVKPNQEYQFLYFFLKSIYFFLKNNAELTGRAALNDTGQIAKTVDK